MTVVYLGLGSNLGDRAAHLRRALALLAPEIVVRKKSPVYETEPVYEKNQPKFLNMAAEAETKLPARALLQKTQSVEKEMGRCDDTHNKPRVIDIDLLFYGSERTDEPGLIVPHPGIAERAFVLFPLADIAPDFVHPVLGSRIRELKEELGTSTDLRKTEIAI